MQYITVPVTNEDMLLHFLADQLSESLCDALSEDLNGMLLEAHKDLVFASQQALSMFERSKPCATKT